MKKVSELEGALLDYWVAQAQGWKMDADVWHLVLEETESSGMYAEVCGQGDWKPSTNWAQGGPIIERENIATVKLEGKWRAFLDGRMYSADEEWIDAYYYDADAEGATALVAAMRAYVASKFGAEVPEVTP